MSEAGGLGEERPRPQYGEYATPEEQRARMGQSLPTAPAAPLPIPPATTVVAHPTRRADMIITVALIVYGLMTVFGSVPQLLDFSGFAASWMSMAGISGEFTNVASGELWGRIGAAVFVVGWAGTAVLSWRSLTARRVSWWIPLLGAIVTFLAVTFCLSVPLLSDPVIAAHFGI